MVRTTIGALIGATIMGLFGFFNHVPGMPGGAPLMIDVLVSAIPGCAIGAIVGLVVHIVRR